MPDIRHLMNIPEDDRNQIFRLFAIRLRLWKGEPLPDVEQQFWDTIYSKCLAGHSSGVNRFPTMTCTRKSKPNRTRQKLLRCCWLTRTKSASARKTVYGNSLRLLI